MEHQMIERKEQSSPDYGKLLRTLKKRTSMSTKSQSSFSKDWPTSVSFSVLNKIQSFSVKKRNTCKPQPSQSQKRESRQVTLNTISVVSFNRPLTCESESRMTQVSEKRKRDCSKKVSLFDFVKQEKLVRLEQEKQFLLNTLYEQNAEIHRIDEDQATENKPNAINFKAYRFLNKLLNLKEQIYQTAQCRPKTTGYELRKTRRNKPIF